MTKNKGEKRATHRFEIPGATVNYHHEGFISLKKIQGEENCPIMNLSQNGICFMSQEELSPNSDIEIKIHVPDSQKDLNIKGHVRWTSLYPRVDYKYQNGIEFGMDSIFKGLSATEELTALLSWEQEFGGSS